MKTALASIVMSVLLVAGVFGQTPNEEDSESVDSTSLGGAFLDSGETDSALADTSLFLPTLNRTKATSVTNPVDLEAHLSQKPTVALFKSLLVPGWGQIGNKRYLKAAIVIGLDTWFISRAVHYGRQASDARRKWQAASSNSDKISLYNDFDNKRGQRNKFIWFTGIVTFLSVFDAYVDAHLSGSPQDKRNNSFDVTFAPQPEGGGYLAVRLNL